MRTRMRTPKVAASVAAATYGGGVHGSSGVGSSQEGEEELV